jgi:hypothetical protein
VNGSGKKVKKRERELRVTATRNCNCAEEIANLVDLARPPVLCENDKTMK